MSTSWLASYEMEPLPSHLCPPQSPPGPLSHPGHKHPQEYCWTSSRGRNCAFHRHFIRCSSSGNKWPSDSLHCEGVALIGRLQWPTIVWCEPPACQIGSLLFWCCCDCSSTQLLEQSFNKKLRCFFEGIFVNCEYWLSFFYHGHLQMNLPWFTSNHPSFWAAKVRAMFM